MIAAMTDGAARLVDVFGLVTWDDALTEPRACGPAGWIERIRATRGNRPFLDKLATL